MHDLSSFQQNQKIQILMPRIGIIYFLYEKLTFLDSDLELCPSDISVTLNTNVIVLNIILLMFDKNSFEFYFSSYIPMFSLIIGITVIFLTNSKEGSVI